MLLAEELILLLLDDDTGRWLVRRKAARQAVRIALVFELLADRALGLDDDGRLVTGIPGLVAGDPVRSRVVDEAVGHRPSELTRPPRGETTALVRRLRGKGVLRRGVLRPGRHLPRDAHPEAGVRARLLETLTTRLRPDRHSALLVAIVYELDLLGTLFPHHDSFELAQRAATIVSDLRTDQHYAPTSLERDAGVDEVSSSRDLSWIGDAIDVLDVMAGVVQLVSLPFRAIRFIGDLLP